MYDLARLPLLNLLQYPALLFALVAFSCTGRVGETGKASTESPVGDQSSAVYTWNTELCVLKGSYDPQKLSLQLIENTYKLWMDDWTLESPSVATSPEDVSRLSLEKLTAEYEATRAGLANLAPVSDTYWQSIKSQKMSALDAEFKLKKMAIMAYADPEVLLQGSIFDCQEYVEALAKSDTAVLLHSWARLVDEQKARNGLPEKLAADYDRKLRAPDKLKYAQVELMAYGWWNCINKHVQYVVRDEIMEEEFNKLFFHIESQCDEP
jgi:hypothetical protein